MSRTDGSSAAAARTRVSDRLPQPPDETPRVPPAELPDVPERLPPSVPEIPATPTVVPSPMRPEVPEPGERRSRAGRADGSFARTAVGRPAGR